MENQCRKLYRSRKNRTVWGILGGMGEYFNVDPVIFRVIFVCLMLITAIVPMLLAYVIAYFIIPPAPQDN